MKGLLRNWQGMAIGILIVMINLIFVLQAGVAYGRFDWSQYAGAYDLYRLFLPFVPKDYQFTVTGVNAIARPSTFSGKCPTTITFSGEITVNGAGTVTYTWDRSDGAVGPILSIVFGGAGTRNVIDTWTLGGPGFNYNGWEKLHALSPNDVSSATANFSITCNP